MNFQDTLLKVKTILGDTIELQILSKEHFEDSVSEFRNELTVYSKIETFSSVKVVYLYKDSTFIINYSSGYGLKIRGKKEFQSLFENANYSMIKLLFDESSSKFYYYFTIYPSFIKKFLMKNEHIVVEGFETSFYRLENGNQRESFSKTVRFQDDSILIYRERTEDIFQGSWVPDFEGFKFLFENHFIG